LLKISTETGGAATGLVFDDADTDAAEENENQTRTEKERNRKWAMEEKNLIFLRSNTQDHKSASLSGYPF
jgi:hypothetical protein